MSMRNTKRFLIGVFLIGMLFFAQGKPVYAGAWGESIGSAFLKQGLEKVYNYIQNTLLANLKVMAYQFLSRQITSVISGNGLSGGGAQFITDWENFLYDEAGKQTRLVVRDFFTETLRGAESSTYIPLGSEGEGTETEMSYPQYLKEIAADTIINEGKGEYTLNQYCASPSMMFTSEDMRCFDAYWVNPMNNPYGFVQATQEIYQSEKEKQEEIKKTQAIAYDGYKGVADKETGKIVTPGSTIRGIFDSLNNQLIGLPSSAKSPEEIAAMSASMFINSLLQQALQQGLARVENELTTLAEQKINEAIEKATDLLGPAGQFLDRSGATSEIKDGTTKWLLGT